MLGGRRMSSLWRIESPAQQSSEQHTSPKESGFHSAFRYTKQGCGFSDASSFKHAQAKGRAKSNREHFYDAFQVLPGLFLVKSLFRIRLGSFELFSSDGLICFMLSVNRDQSMV